MILIDILVIAIIALSVYCAYRKGFVRTLFSLVSFVLALFLSYRIYPFVSSLLRRTPIYSGVQSGVANAIGAGEAAEVGEQAFMEGLAVPNFVRSSMLENDNSVARAALNATGIGEFATNFLANIIMNIIALVVVFIVVFIALRVISSMLNLVTKLPVIRSANRLLGIGVGLIRGILLVWAFLLIITLFGTTPPIDVLFSQLDNSYIARYFYDTNMLLNNVFRIVM